MMNISCDGTAVGGVTRVALALSQEFQNRGWGVTSLFPAGIDRAMLKNWGAAHGVDARPSGRWLEGGRLAKLANPFRLYREVRAVRPDFAIIHYGGSHFSARDVLAARLGGAGKSVVVLHSPVPWREAGFIRRINTWIGARLANLVVSVSPPVRDIVAATPVPVRKLTVIHGGVVPPQSPLTRAEGRRRLGIPDEAFVVSTIVRLVPEKGVHLLLEALGSLPKDCARAWLLVKGDDGPELARLNAEAQRQLPGRWKILDALANNDAIYAAADIFALPSLQEGYPLVLLEAAFHGLPVVSTQVGGIPELVIHGETGLLVPAGSVSGLAEAIATLLRAPAMSARMSARARIRASAEFSARVMADRFEAAMLASR